ncbi:peptidoglycan-binding domain-containing protein [Streptomyces sp. NPDC006430]|uniref:peptidoglycan-binding domain-containing protein n=1 Tax=Streptomyces sp. NPDC006430 TaxID=3154299 RepID=UPI0033A5E9D5
MSHHFDDSGGVPDDRLLVRPYVASSGQPSPVAAPAWPQSGPVPVSFGMPEDRSGGPASAPEPVSEPAPDEVPAGVGPRAGRGRGRERERGSRLPLMAFALLALGAAGGLVLLLNGSDPKPQRSVAPPELSLPVLPARSPGVDAGPSAAASVRPSAPNASASSSPSASKSPKPTLPSASAAQPSAGSSGTLRMGDRGAEVTALQERLYRQGFTYVAVTGVYDSQTKRGVAQLQRDRDIKGDPPGVYGPATQAAFGT